MELDDLLLAITEVSRSVTRMPCAPEDKEEVLDKIQDLFFRFRAVSNIFASGAKFSEKEQVKSKNRNPTEEQTVVKLCASPSVGNSESSKMQEKVHCMDEKLNMLEQKLTRVEAGQGRILSLRSEFSAHLTTLSQMREAQDSVNNRVARIENKANDLEVLQNRIEEINTLVKSKCDQASFATELLKIHQEIANLEGLVKGDTKGTEKFVAFSATAKPSPFRRKYTAANVIPFQDVQFNFNNCYNPELSKFKTKFVGCYVFSTSINTNSEGDFEAAIVHNDIEVALFGTPGNKDLQTGTSVILQLQPDDTVCVKVAEQSHHKPGVEVGSGFSNFIGYKIA